MHKGLTKFEAIGNRMPGKLHTRTVKLNGGIHWWARVRLPCEFESCRLRVKSQRPTAYLRVLLGKLYSVTQVVWHKVLLT